MGAVYMRKNNQDEVRAGMNSTLAGYASSAVTSWYNLRLFPEDAGSAAGGASSGSNTANGNKAPIGVDAVQRVVIQAPAPAVTGADAVSGTNGVATVSDTNGANAVSDTSGAMVSDTNGANAVSGTVGENGRFTPVPVPPPALTLTRNEGGWLVSDTGGEKNADTQSIESYIRALLDIEGEDFFSAGETSGNSAAGSSAAGNSANFTGAASGWVRLELGDGNTREIKLAPAPEQESRYHAIALGSGARSGFVFVLSEWRKNTLFRDTSYFVKQ
jgi:hypothetical protein